MISRKKNHQRIAALCRVGMRENKKRVQQRPNSKKFLLIYSTTKKSLATGKRCFACKLKALWKQITVKEIKLISIRELHAGAKAFFAVPSAVDEIIIGSQKESFKEIPIFFMYSSYNGIESTSFITWKARGKGVFYFFAFEKLSDHQKQSKDVKWKEEGLVKGPQYQMILVGDPLEIGDCLKTSPEVQKTTKGRLRFLPLAELFCCWKNMSRWRLSEAILRRVVHDSINCGIFQLLKCFLALKIKLNSRSITYEKIWSQNAKNEMINTLFTK